MKTIILLFFFILHSSAAFFLYADTEKEITLKQVLDQPLAYHNKTILVLVKHVEFSPSTTKSCFGEKYQSAEVSDGTGSVVLNCLPSDYSINLGQSIDLFIEVARKCKNLVTGYTCDEMNAGKIEKDKTAGVVSMRAAACCMEYYPDSQEPENWDVTFQITEQKK